MQRCSGELRILFVLISVLILGIGFLALWFYPIHGKKLEENLIKKANVTIMIEVMHYLVKRLGTTIAKEKWDLFSSMDFLIGELEFEDLNSVFIELCKYTHTGIRGRDATILHFLSSNKITKLCTHDKSFKKIQNLEIMDPIPEKV